MATLTIGGTQTGGTSKTLTYAGQDASGRHRYVLPEHTPLSQRVLVVGSKSQPVTKDSLGASEATVDIALTESAPSESCCSTVRGGLYINLKVRWDLNQPASLADLGIDILQGVSFATFLEDLIKKGVVTLSP